MLSGFCNGMTVIFTIFSVCPWQPVCSLVLEEQDVLHVAGMVDFLALSHWCGLQDLVQSRRLIYWAYVSTTAAYPQSLYVCSNVELQAAHYATGTHDDSQTTLMNRNELNH